MYIPNVEVHESETLGHIAELLEQYGTDARLLAGGTDLLVDLKTGRLRATHLISLHRVAAMRGLTVLDSGLRIGALTTIAELNAAEAVLERFAPLLDASREIGGPQVRNLATVGGNVASAVPCADLPPLLMVLKAYAEVWSPKSTRTVLVETFYVGPRRTVLQRGEVLTAIVVPHLPAGFGAAYARFGLRNGNAIAVASVAASLSLSEDNLVGEARIALGAVAPTPTLARSCGEILVGKAADPSWFQEAARMARRAAAPISDVRGSAEFRRELVEVLTRRALAMAAQRARESFS